MAFTFQVVNACKMAQSYVKLFLQAIEVPVDALPFAGVIEQFPFASVPMPITLIEVGECHFPEGVSAVNVQNFKLTLTVHRVSPLSADGNAFMDDIGILAKLAAQLRTDRTMNGNVKRCHIDCIQTGKASDLQLWLLNNQATSTLAAASLPLTLEWEEPQ